jgi:hypothetical protein
MYERQKKRVKLSKPWFSKICRECGDTVKDEYMYSYRHFFYSLIGSCTRRVYTCSNCASSYDDIIRLNPDHFNKVVAPVPVHVGASDADV